MKRKVLKNKDFSHGKKQPNIEFLTGFTGYLHADRYAGYPSLPKEILLVGCWDHARVY